MKILIAEDDPISQTLMSHMLRSLGDCRVARDGNEAIELFRTAHEEKSPYDLVCLDIMMPGKSGQEVLVDLREIEKSFGVDSKYSVKVVMTTGLSDAQSVVSAFEHGCEAYVTKPVSREILFSTLRQLGLSV